MTEQEKFFFDHGYAQAKREFDKAIEDIKAELTKGYVDDKPSNFRYTRVMLKDVLEIIDKHMEGVSK